MNAWVSARRLIADSRRGRKRPLELHGFGFGYPRYYRRWDQSHPCPGAKYDRYPAGRVFHLPLIGEEIRLQVLVMVSLAEMLAGLFWASGIRFSRRRRRARVFPSCSPGTTTT